MPQTYSNRVVNGLARRALQLPGVGTPFCAMANRAGMSSISRWASRHSGYTPSLVKFLVRTSAGGCRVGVMSSAQGRDQIARSLWLKGMNGYEPPLPRLYSRLVRGASVVLDVGANSGLYAILAAMSEPVCRVFSFEPFPEAIECLEENLRLNHLIDRVTIVRAAAGREVGETELFVPEKIFGKVLETSASLVKEFRPRHSAVLKVPVETLDAFVAREKLQRISLIRADVEGAEHQVLEGAGQVLRDHRPFVVVEILAEITAGYLEPLRAKADYRALCIGTDTLIPQSTVRCVPGNFNHLWYPAEKHEQMLEIAEDSGLRMAVN